MNNEYNPILICNGNEHDLKNGGELTCGGCGYVFDSNEAEELFKNVEFKPGRREFGGDVYSSTPLCCIQCFREFKEIYFSERRETHYVYPSSIFKNRYITKYGELILEKDSHFAKFIPSWDPSKSCQMAHADAIAYMLYSYLCPLGYSAEIVELHVGAISYWELCVLDECIPSVLHEDISSLVRGCLRTYLLKNFDKIIVSMREMENDHFFSVGGNEND